MSNTDPEPIMVIKKKVVIKHQIIALAEHYERLHQKGKYPKPVNTICAAICWELMARDYDISPIYIRQILPRRFKNKYTCSGTSTTTATTNTNITKD